jgi:hypothetical protein
VLAQRVLRVPVYDGNSGDADGGRGERGMETWSGTPRCEEDVRVVWEELGP